jgi:hypothetical protein
MFLLAGGGAFAEQTAWPEFHNGVAAGLRLAPGTHQLTRTWVVYNKPPGGARLPCSCAMHELGLSAFGGVRSVLLWLMLSAAQSACCRAELHTRRHADGPGADRTPQVRSAA